MSRELCLVNDEGVVEDGFYSRESAEARLAAISDDDLEIEHRDLYDEDGFWIEEPDGDEDDA